MRNLPHKDVCFGWWLVLTWILRKQFRDVSARYCDRRVRKILWYVWSVGKMCWESSGYGIVYRREPYWASRLNNWVIERSLIRHPDTTFSSACETLNWYAYKLMPTIVVTSTPDGLWLRIFFTWRWVSQITSPVSRALRTTRLLIYIKYHLTREQVQRESIMVKIVPIKRIKRIFYEAVLVSCCVLALIHLSLFARRQSSMT